MQTRLRLVQHHQTGRARRQQRGQQQQIAQRAVGKLGGLQRAQQTVLGERQFEPPVAAGDLQFAAGKGIAERRVERRRIADLANGLQRGRKIGAVVGEHGRSDRKSVV